MNFSSGYAGAQEMPAADGLLAGLVKGDVGIAEREMLAAIDRSQGIIEFSLDGRVLHANENFLRAVGYTASEIIGIHHSIFVDPVYATSEEYRSFWARLQRGDYIVDKFRRVAKGGREIWIQASYNPIFDGNGLPMRVVKFATDITEQEALSRDARGQIEAITKASAVIEFDLDGTILTANENFCRLVGYGLEEIRGRRHSMFVDSEHARGSDYRQFWEALAEGQFQTGKFRRFGKGGRLLWIQAAYNPIFGGDGRPLKVVKFATDITQHENFARDAGGQLQAIAKSQATIEFMINGTILTANENFCQLMGYHLDEIRARHHAIFVDQDYADSEEYAEFWHSLSLGEFRRGKFMRLAKGDRQVWIQASYNPVFDDRGRIVKVVKYATDLSDQLEREREAGELREINAQLEKARREAEKAAALKSQFLATMSHEIRTPLNGLLGMLEVTLRNETDPTQREYISTARSSADSLLRILNDILDYSKMEAGQLQLEIVPMSLRQVIDDVVSMFSLQAREKGLRLVEQISDSVPDWIKGDPTRLRQILTNLISNGLKFTEAGSVSITASWQSVYGMLRIEVRDSGIGMAADTQQRLFSRFSQADASTTRRFGGTGLGLAICREIVTTMGGRIGVASRAGEGSTFWMEVPAAVASEPSFARPHLVPVSEDHKPLRILVADDNAVNRKVIGLLLAPFKHDLVFAENGAEAVRANDENVFDLVLMDVSMPVMDGPTATRAIRSRTGQAGRVPVIALTANAMVGDRDSYLEAGMSDYLSKPVDVRKLEDMIARYGAASPIWTAETASDMAANDVGDMFAGVNARLDALIADGMQQAGPLG